ncbi:4'-phosphopantetheinyl transferase superfamily protein [Pseudarthrobacter sp. NamE2]|uniref:4'-phosphopantetheinyl transferase family protein n=1 Tax=Pseudarthrobacter sp. NamE2 TaxID=2576838 RepID=UPI0010FE01BA|nr:4'-phosphopantetheinyl transferase superfamily protein [Pseudarthrobacter sp. NamE2]TLM84987.1 4'-phosphopantetheinyl transferase superfamily protein [Pseudarthrobacter sp. NamE2]
MTPELVVHAVPPFSLSGAAERVQRDAQALLDGPELARAQAMEPASRSRFLAGRLAQRRFAAELLGVRGSRLVAAYSCPRCGTGPGITHGRPGYLLDGGPAPLVLSLSRAAGWTLLAAVAGPPDSCRLGVDVEDPARTGFDGFPALALTHAEQQVVGHLSGGALLAGRARLWARKEAVLKMTGDGLRTAPSSLDVLQRNDVRDLLPAETGLPARLAAAVALSWAVPQPTGRGGRASS